MSQLRDALFEHEIFEAAAGGASYGLYHIRKIEASWEFTKDEAQLELAAMKSAGLITENGDYWKATKAGKVEREKRWQVLLRRHPALNEQKGQLKDLVLSLIFSSGEMWMVGQISESLYAEALYIYLWSKTSFEIEAVVADLEQTGYIQIIELPFHTEQIRKLATTAEGRIHYTRNVLPRLGLLKDYSILAPLEPNVEPPIFAELGLLDSMADNLQFRWEEAERCRSAGAWLALTVMHGSILEALLLSSLENNVGVAMASNKAPRDKSGSSPLKTWKLEALLNVAADIGLVEPTLALYGHALRDSRNSIHPAKQVRERSQPDEKVTEISGRVIRGVISSLRAYKAV